MWNCLWGNALKRSPGIICKSRVSYPGPGFLSSATWPSLPKKHYNGLNQTNQSMASPGPHWIVLVKTKGRDLGPGLNGRQPNELTMLTRPITSGLVSRLDLKNRMEILLFFQNALYPLTFFFQNALYPYCNLVCLFVFNVPLKHLRSYHDGACF